MGEWTRERLDKAKAEHHRQGNEGIDAESTWRTLEEALAEIERWQSIAGHWQSTAGQMKRHVASALGDLAKGQSRDTASALFDACALLPQPTDADLPLLEDFEALSGAGPALSEERAREVACLAGVIGAWQSWPGKGEGLGEAAIEAMVAVHEALFRARLISPGDVTPAGQALRSAARGGEGAWGKSVGAVPDTCSVAGCGRTESCGDPDCNFRPRPIATLTRGEASVAHLDIDVSRVEKALLDNGVSRVDAPVLAKVAVEAMKGAAK